MRWLVFGGGEGQCLAGALGLPLGTPVAGIDARSNLIVHGCIEDALEIVRLRPNRLVWRPTNQRLPLPRALHWMLGRVDAVIAADHMMADALAGTNVPVVIIPTSINATIDCGRRQQTSSVAGLRLVVTLDELDHSASAAMAIIETLVTGGKAPRIDGRTGGLVASSGPAFPIDAAYLHVTDSIDEEAVDTYLRDLRRWHRLDGVVELDGDCHAARPTDDQSLAERIAGFDLHLTNSGTHSIGRSALLAGAAGIATIMPDVGDDAIADWAWRCGHRTEYLDDDSVRVHLDVDSTVTAIRAATHDPTARVTLATAAQSIARTRQIEHWLPRWRDVLARVPTSSKRVG